MKEILSYNEFCCGQTHHSCRTAEMALLRPLKFFASWPRRERLRGFDKRDCVESLGMKRRIPVDSPESADYKKTGGNFIHENEVGYERFNPDQYKVAGED